MNPLVSIIVPVYNVKELLVECLESLVNQTLKEIEIIVVDDASTDDSKRIIEKYLVLDNRVKAIYLKTNGGLSAARNTGLVQAKGDFVGFVDSDDFVENDMFEKMYYASVDHQTDIVSCGYKKYGNNKVISEHLFPIKSSSHINHDDMLHFLAQAHEMRFIWFVWRNIYKREMLMNNQINFNEQARFAEDSVFNFKAFYHANGVQLIADKLYYYRETVSSLTSKKGKIYLEENLIRQYQEKIDLISLLKLKSEFIDDLSKYVVVHQLPMMLSNIIDLNLNNIEEEINRILTIPMIKESLRKVSFFNPELPRGIQLTIMLSKFRQAGLLKYLYNKI